MLWEFKKHVRRSFWHSSPCCWDTVQNLGCKSSGKFCSNELNTHSSLHEYQRGWSMHRAASSMRTLPHSLYSGHAVDGGNYALLRALKYCDSYGFIGLYVVQRFLHQQHLWVSLFFRNLADKVIAHANEDPSQYTRPKSILEYP